MSRRASSRGSSLDRRLGAFVVALSALLAANNLLPYLGLREDSCQAMFSGLATGPTSNNHLFMPQRSVGDHYVYLRELRVEVDPPPATEVTAYLVDWLAREDRRFNTDAVRAVLWQLCREGHAVRLSHRDRASGELEQQDDACAGRFGAPSWWIPVRLYETDLPGGS